eukprot:7759066-Lingulodinium_polyedra.AAC.1
MERGQRPTGCGDPRQRKMLHDRGDGRDFVPTKHKCKKCWTGIIPGLCRLCRPYRCRADTG